MNQKPPIAPVSSPVSSPVFSIKAFQESLSKSPLAQLSKKRKADDAKESTSGSPSYISNRPLAQLSKKRKADDAKESTPGSQSYISNSPLTRLSKKHQEERGQQPPPVSIESFHRSTGALIIKHKLNASKPSKKEPA